MNDQTTHSHDCEGSTLVGVLIATVMLGGLVYSTTMMSHVELRDARVGLDRLRALYVAQGGLERAVNEIKTASRKAAVVDPLFGVKALFGGGPTYTEHTGLRTVSLAAGTATVGEFSVTMTAVDRDGGLDVTIRSTGYVPAAPENLPPAAREPEKRVVESMVRVEATPSRVFDNAYFINNWGWLYGDTIYVNGNARSNGQFDAGGYAPTITGQATYDNMAWAGANADLQGYRDDNGDGLHDGNDGGIFAGWDVAGSTNVQGNGGLATNQHDFQEAVPMPNLSDLTMYEAQAAAQSGQISIAGTVVSDGVAGDDPGEHENLYLIGTATDPVEITGTVVARGDVIISGVVQGQGAIYAGGNVYVPSDLTYADPPATARPTTNSEADTEAWITTNKDKDFLGLFAGENVVIGDHTDSTWRSYVGGWMSHSLNKSREDAGEDGIPNTKAGRDGILGTADDDVLEDDGVWTVETYTAADQALGLIPAGMTVGDPIPGSGEDIDGDGQYDDTIGLSELSLALTISSSQFDGNVPTGTTAFSDIADNGITRLDGAFYTNHAFAFVSLPSSPIEVNGGIVSRNEAIVYGSPYITWNYDARMLGSAGGIASSLLPRTLAPIMTLSWMELDWDPHSQAIAAAKAAEVEVQ
ncbi:MAG: hypothetical protein AAF628_27200 [Planctomycetota bacterium]